MYKFILMVLAAAIALLFAEPYISTQSYGEYSKGAYYGFAFLSIMWAYQCGYAAGKSNGYFTGKAIGYESGFDAGAHHARVMASMNKEV